MCPDVKRRWPNLTREQEHDLTRLEYVSSKKPDDLSTSWRVATQPASTNTGYKARDWQPPVEEKCYLPDDVKALLIRKIMARLYERFINGPEEARKIAQAIISNGIPKNTR